MYYEEASRSRGELTGRFSEGQGGPGTRPKSMALEPEHRAAQVTNTRKAAHERVARRFPRRDIDEADIGRQQHRLRNGSKHNMCASISPRISVRPPPWTVVALAAAATVPISAIV
jgi:hypothetical protein